MASADKNRYSLLIAVLLFGLLLPFLAPLYAAEQKSSVTILQLTEAEREWLAGHPRIQVGVMDAWPPLDYLDQNKRPQGIGSEYLASLNKLLGDVLVPVPAPFEENYERVLGGQLDALMDITQRPDRELLFNFTRPYIVIPHAIVGRKGGVYFKSEQDLSGKTVALEHSFYNITHFKNNYPAVIIREYQTTSEALDAVSRGEADAYAGNRAVAIYLIEKELLNNLRLMGKLEQPRSTLQIATRKGEPLLASILDKALLAIPESEKQAIFSKWVSLEYKHKVDYTVIWKILTGALAVVALFLVWNRRLGKEVAIRKETEAQLQSNQLRLEELLQERTSHIHELSEAKERAEAADHLKSAFLATMSHELRTPLNSIIGFTGILLQSLSGPINEEQEKQLTMVRTSANHLLSLISDILDISKIEAGQLTIDSEPFDLKESIVRVVQTVRPLAEKKGLELSVKIADDIGAIVSDLRRVEQVLLNLVSNAVKFTEKGSICISCVRNGATYVTTVTDTGIGIKDTDLDLLFQPFRQVDTGLSRKYEGTGLGLSICKKLLVLMDGSIKVSSCPGEGSSFSFTLPLARSGA